MAKVYRNQPVTRLELESLLALATAEEADFFTRRNPHLIEPYRDRLLCFALCQGAALQFLGRGYGVGDFDIHFFYAQNPAKPRLCRKPKHAVSDVGGFNSIPMDYLRTVVPGATPTTQLESIVVQLQSFLRRRPTSNAFHLSQKAVVGLFPPGLFGRELWPPL